MKGLTLTILAYLSSEFACFRNDITRDTFWHTVQTSDVQHQPRTVSDEKVKFISLRNSISKNKSTENKRVPRDAASHSLNISDYKISNKPRNSTTDDKEIKSVTTEINSDIQQTHRYPITAFSNSIPDQDESQTSQRLDLNSEVVEDKNVTEKKSNNAQEIHGNHLRRSLREYKENDSTADSFAKTDFKKGKNKRKRPCRRCYCPCCGNFFPSSCCSYGCDCTCDDGDNSNTCSDCDCPWDSCCQGNCGGCPAGGCCGPCGISACPCGCCCCGNAIHRGLSRGDGPPTRQAAGCMGMFGGLGREGSIGCNMGLGGGICGSCRGRGQTSPSGGGCGRSNLGCQFAGYRSFGCRDRNKNNNNNNNKK